MTLRAAESSIGLVKSIDSDSKQTLSSRVVSLWLVRKAKGRTDVVCLVKDDDAFRAHFFGYLVCDLGIEEVVEGVDDDVCVCQLHAPLAEISPRDSGRNVPFSES